MDRVCGGRHRVALAAMADEVRRYWKTPALLAASCAAGIGFALPTLVLHGRLTVRPVPGGDLGLAWRSGVRTIGATQQQALDELGVLLLGSALATLGVAAVTVLVLCLARESERAAELTVRRAVGAGRRVLVASAAAEGVLIALAGGAAGAAVAVGAAAASEPWPGRVAAGLPAVAAVGGAALAVAVLAGVLIPVLLPRRRIGEAEPRSPTPLLPSAVQIGGCLIALTMGALLARHAAAVAGGGGAPVRGAVSTVRTAALPPQQRAAHYATLLDRLQGDRRERVSLTSPGTLLGLGPTSMVTTDCGQCSEGGLPVKWKVKAASHRFVSTDTFEMIGVRVVEGRGITDRDTWDAPRVAVVSRGLAAREFQDGRALGRRIRVVDDGADWSTVVGVVDEPAPTGLGASLQPRYAVYLSVLQHPPATAELLTVAGTRPGARPVEAMRAAQAAPLQWLAARFASQGWAMLGIAALGSLAVARLWVASLLLEFGVRRAMGAPRRRILGYVLVRALAVCAAGIVGGLWFGAAIWGVLADLVAGLEPWDRGAVLRFAAGLVIGTLLGALPPAWRAARATPASLLAAP